MTATIERPALVATKTVIQKSKEPKVARTGGDSARTILFNDEFHTFQEVANQLMRAIRCTYSEGMAIANVVHTTGSAVVYVGPLERCEAVAMTLEEIALKVKVER